MVLHLQALLPGARVGFAARAAWLANFIDRYREQQIEILMAGGPVLTGRLAERVFDCFPQGKPIARLQMQFEFLLLRCRPGSRCRASRGIVAHLDGIFFGFIDLGVPPVAS